MIYNLSIIIIIIYIFGSCSALTDDNNLIHQEESILYERLKTESNLNELYQLLLKSNGVDDITRIQHVATQDDIQRLNLEHTVRIKLSWK